MIKKTLFWYDYETFGADPQKDRPVQFAGVRTDCELNIVGEPITVFCKPSPDYLPHPDACIITGIVPQIAEQKGLCESEFISIIQQQFAEPQTCTLGYNNVRFDDEVTRNCLYRNFFDPYLREWQNGNSRWDLLDVFRAAYALRPEGINWPIDDRGLPSFKLEGLTKANNVVHEAAHDALSDVYATINIAKLLRTAQPKLYDFLWENRHKKSALNLLHLGSFKPVVHVSGKYPAIKSCIGVVLPICQHPTNANGIIVYDLSSNPDDMLSCSITEIKERVFTSTANLPYGCNRIPLKTVHVNKCPVLAPISVIRPVDAERLSINLSECYDHAEKIKLAADIAAKISEVFVDSHFDKGTDPDLSIYSGGFFSEADRKKMNNIRNLPVDLLAKTEFLFDDERLPEMLFRYRARNYPETLNQKERECWIEFCRDRLLGLRPGAGITFPDYFERLRALQQIDGIDSSVLKALYSYASKVAGKLNIDLDKIVNSSRSE